jgi:hypothetical protein
MICGTYLLDGVAHRTIFYEVLYLLFRHELDDTIKAFGGKLYMISRGVMPTMTHIER